LVVELSGLPVEQGGSPPKASYVNYYIVESR